MNVKELFDKAENGVLTWEQFQAAMTAGNAKFVDISEGNYVSKNKYDADISSRDTQITTLNDTIKTRDTDLSNLKSQLEAAGADATKLTDLTNQFSALQTKYNDDTKNYKAQLAKQAYEFAVKDFANTKKFTSTAAKRDFVQSMIAKGLKLENEKILGADDFVTAYKAENEDAFVVEEQNPPGQQLPLFVTPTPGEPAKPAENAFSKVFHFSGVRPQEQK